MLLTLNLAATLELILNSEKLSINWMPHQSLDNFPCSVQQSFVSPPHSFVVVMMRWVWAVAGVTGGLVKWGASEGDTGENSIYSTHLATLGKAWLG